MGRDLEASIDLYWIPLGAGGQVVRRCGRLYEALAARLRHRAPAALYHSALEIRVPAGRYRVEQTPVPDGDGARRGVVAQGPVGLRAAGRLRLFRYEVRRWPDGAIPDGDLAVGGPRRVSTDLDAARHVLDLVPQVPTPTWGRDELGTGEMWNSNAIVAWLLERAGLDAAALAPPSGGRAPGWRAASSSRGAMLRRAGRLPPPSGNRSAARRQPLTRRRGRPPPAGPSPVTGSGSVLATAWRTENSAAGEPAPPGTTRSGQPAAGGDRRGGRPGDRADG
ncbi:MAG: hypothetical protein ACXV1K_06365 [Kineosporiaceae bacterium]